MRTTITIARQLGCGASIIGQSIAQELGIRCIDREIVSQTARQFQIDEEELASREEKVSSFWDRILSGMAIVAPEAAYVSAPTPTLTDQEIFASETEVMKRITEAEDCVIVGRAAAHVLPAHPGMINIYLHAPASFRIPRIREYYNLPDDASARATLKSSDDMRAKVISQMTGRDTTDLRNYHIALDSSLLPIPEIADLLIHCIRRRIKTGHPL